MKFAFLMVAAFCTTVVVAIDSDSCTFDLKAASKAVFERNDSNCPNLAKDPLGFVKRGPDIWNPVKNADVAETNKKVAAALVAEREGDLFSMRSPETVIDLLGGKEAAARLHNNARMAEGCVLPNADGGKYRVTFRYRGNHVVGSNWSGAYLIVIPDTKDRWQYINMPDTGLDSDYWFDCERVIDIPKGVKRVTLALRQDGVGYLKISNLKFAANAEEVRPEIEMRAIPYNWIDNRFAIESGDVATVAVSWRCTKGAKFSPSEDGVEFVLPRGFEFVGINVPSTAKRPVEVLPQPDGTTLVRAPMTGRLRPFPGERFHAQQAMSLLVRAKCPAGSEGRMTFRSVRGANGEQIGEDGAVTLFAVEPVRCGTPRRYFTGSMMHYDLEMFRFGEKANEIYADYLRRHGVRWIIPQVPHMLEDSTLVGVWRAAGFDYITPQWHDYLSNGFLIGNEPGRPEADRYRPEDPNKKYSSYPGASCPAATYEERPFFLTNVIVKIEKATRGADGMWMNWELHPYGKGCFCDGCKERLKGWKGTPQHMRSVMHGKMVKTMQKHFKRMFGDNAPCFMPAVSWADCCTWAINADYQSAKRPQDYISELNWLPAWGPYHGWACADGSPYNEQRGQSVLVHLAMADARASVDAICVGKNRPKLIAQPAGPNWIIQPEWLEIQMDAAFFSGWEACIPWIFPYGCDARHWAAFCRAVDTAAKYEDVVFDGTRNDAAVTVTPKAGFEVTCLKPDGMFLPDATNVPLLQQITYDYRGRRYVAVFNYDDLRHCEFTLKTNGKSYDLSLPASACRVFEYEMPSASAEKPWLVLNEDNDHFFKNPTELMTEAALKAYVDDFARGHVTHFFMCPVGQRASYGSKVWEPIWSGMDEPARPNFATTPDGTHDIWCVNCKKLHDAGIDPYEVWTKRCREKGVSPWVTMRMNDVHFCNITNYFRNATFCRTRRDLWLNPKTDFGEWAESQLDYAKKEVRDYNFAVVREMAERWDIDGFELDWMRFGYCLRPGHEAEDAHFVTEFVRDVRAALDEIGARKGRRIALGTRVCYDPDVSRELGMDVEEWARLGLLDVIVPHSFLSVDASIPVAKWKSRIGAVAPKVKIVPGIDSARERFPWKKFPHDLEVMRPSDYRGVADVFRRDGADGVYLFNLPYNGKWPTDGHRHGDMATEVYERGLDPVATADLPRTYPPAYHDFPFAFRPAAPCRSDEIRAAIQPYIDRGEIAGIVSILSDDELNLTVDCFGWADVENRVPMTPDSVFAVFSMTKTVTGCALMCAIDRGLLSMDDLVEKYVPEFTNAANKVTIRQCMCHSTGLDGYDAPRYSRQVTLEEAAVRYAKDSTRFAAPDEQFRYSSWLDVGARCIEVASGMKFEDFIKKNILNPLGMTSTGFNLTPDMESRLVKPYTTEGGLFRPGNDDCCEKLRQTAKDHVEPWASGGLFSTPSDFIKFSQMLAHHGFYRGTWIVSRETFDRIWAVKQTASGVKEPYSVGAWLYGDWMGHEGAMRTDQRANLKTGHSRLFFIQTENKAGKAFFNAKRDWNVACDRYQHVKVPFSEKSVKPDKNDTARKLVESPGVIDEKKGWRFVDSEAGKEVYIPFEGYYESKGGRLESPRFRLDGEIGKNCFYRFAFSAKCPVDGYWWVDFFDKDGRPLPDVNSRLYASENWTPYDVMVPARPDAAFGQIAFVSKRGAQAKDVSFRRATLAEAAKWCNDFAMTLPKVDLAEPKDAWVKLAKTRARILSGDPVNVVFLGDSIMNDTWCGNVVALIQNALPNANLRCYISVRGSTGCWYYREKGNFKEYVSKYSPDLVLIGGISNYLGKEKGQTLAQAEDCIAETIARCWGIGAEVVVCTPPPSYEFRKDANRRFFDSRLTEPTEDEAYRYLYSEYERRVAMRMGVQLWDLTTAPCEAISRSGRPLNWFKRDAAHNDDRGKQLIAQTMSAYFRSVRLNQDVQ